MSLTLDGYVGGPNGEVDWIMRTLDSQATAWTERSVWEAGAHLMGSRTYADMLAYWPTSTEPLAAPMNAIPKIVFSRSGDLEHDTTTALRNAIDAQQSARLPLRPPAGGWDDTRVLGADLAADIRALKAEPDKDLIAHGGASFARSLINLGCIDEYRLLIHPVVLGSGHALFKDATPFGLTLTEATSFASGIQGLVYRTE